MNFVKFGNTLLLCFDFSNKPLLQYYSVGLFGLITFKYWIDSNLRSTAAGHVQFNYSQLVDFVLKLSPGNIGLSHLTYFLQ